MIYSTYVITKTRLVPSRLVRKFFSRFLFILIIAKRSKAIPKPCGEPVESIGLRIAGVLCLRLPPLLIDFIGWQSHPLGMGMAFPLAKHVPSQSEAVGTDPHLWRRDTALRPAVAPATLRGRLTAEPN